MDAKQKYRKLCKTEDTIPLPSRDWWLDAIAGEDGWDVVCCERDEKMVATLPYAKRQLLLFSIIYMPRLTPNMGVWMKYPEDQKYHSRLSYENELCKELIERLPKFHRFRQRFHHGFTNWLPFYWAGFEQTTRYTYVIEDLDNLDGVYGNFRSNIRTDIRKAQKQVTVHCAEDIEKLYRLYEIGLRRQGIKPSYNLEYLKGLDRACSQRDCRRIFFAEDEKGRVHSGLYLVWDSESAYYLIGASDPELRHSGAGSLVIWEAIQFASTVTKAFDFEGSMMKSIERFFRAFGGVQKPYFSIHKNNSLFRILDVIR